jgi:hypothetical protein
MHLLAFHVGNLVSLTELAGSLGKEITKMASTTFLTMGYAMP